jgi:hypothetical protein
MVNEQILGTMVTPLEFLMPVEASGKFCDATVANYDVYPFGVTKVTVSNSAS